MSIFVAGAACASASAASTANELMARMIPPVTRRSTQNTQSPQSQVSLRVPWFLRVTFVSVFFVCAASTAFAHDVERTQVLLSFARDGSFTLDVSSDPNWLKERLQRYDGSFIDRVVLFVDGHEIRPTSIEFVPARADGLATYRMHGRFPTSARTLRWYYGMVVDPYPLAIQRTDGRVVIEEIAGDAWSGSIDLTGEFKPPLLSQRTVLAVVIGLFCAPLLLRRTRRGRHELL